MKNSVRAAVGGLCTALSVVLMFLGGAIYIFTYAVPMLLGIVIITVNKTLGAKTALSVYFSTSVLSMILVAEKEIVLIYILFFGYYPVLRSKIQKIKSLLLRILLKFILFNITLLIEEIICVYVFGIPFFDGEAFSISIAAVFAVMMNIVFFMYEFMLKYFIVLYDKKLEKRISKIIK
ncbi:MAG: hypothetical protein LUG21_05705 [Clostridiales bacterium]|nr:hypothetical protein [Clostridiales bacterium]